MKQVLEVAQDLKRGGKAGGLLVITSRDGQAHRYTLIIHGSGSSCKQATRMSMHCKDTLMGSKRHPVECVVWA